MGNLKDNEKARREELGPALPAIQRYKIGYHSDEWGVRSLSPVGIYDDAGPWVRYEDHAAALAAGKTAVQDDLLTIRKPTTSAEMLWLLKLAHLVISDVDKTLEETFAPAQELRESFTAADMATAAAQGFRDGVTSVANQPAPDEIINMAREQGLPETEIEGVFRVNADDLCRVADAILAARRQGATNDR